MTQPKSIQGRLLLLVLGAVVAIWLATAVLTWFDARHELDELLDSHLAQAASLLVVQQARELEEDDHGVDAPTLHRYAPQVAFQVFHEGRLSMRTANAPVTPMMDAQALAPSGFKTVQLDGVAWRVFSTYGSKHDVQVYVGERMAPRTAILWAVLRSTLWPMLLALPLLGVAVWWAVRQGLAPLRELGRSLAERQPQALQAMVMPSAPSEMTPMLDALNGLFTRIETLMESERRFTADAAHELRTPIAAIRTQAQVALGESDDAARRHALQATLAGCDRATRLVEQLLTLSRLEAGAQANATQIDLLELVRRVVADIAPQAIDKQQTIELDAAERCFIAGDATLLAVLIRNLVDNAIRYSPPQATIQIGLAQGQGHITLTVDDAGPGLSEADLLRLGTRFFRVLGSGQEGSGLGWSIIKRIASVQGATVRVSRSLKLGGLAVEVTWPVTQGT
ncbi:MAG: ATP-binding protein [Aquabacterium sp.]|nr:ATP-binding protein [Aquabacterium sp.]